MNQCVQSKIEEEGKMRESRFNLKSLSNPSNELCVVSSASCSLPCPDVFPKVFAEKKEINFSAISAPRGKRSFRWHQSAHNG